MELSSIYTIFEIRCAFWPDMQCMEWEVLKLAFSYIPILSIYTVYTVS